MESEQTVRSESTPIVRPLESTVKPVLSGHSKIDKNLINEGRKYAECSPWSILQYFSPALSDNRS